MAAAPQVDSAIAARNRIGARRTTLRRGLAEDLRSNRRSLDALPAASLDTPFASLHNVRSGSWNKTALPRDCHLALARQADTKTRRAEFDLHTELGRHPP